MRGGTIKTERVLNGASRPASLCFGEGSPSTWTPPSATCRSVPNMGHSRSLQHVISHTDPQFHPNLAPRRQPHALTYVTRLASNWPPCPWTPSAAITPPK